MNGKSVQGLMLLEVTAGGEIVIKTDGQDEDEAADVVVQLIAAALRQVTATRLPAGKPKR